MKNANYRHLLMGYGADKVLLDRIMDEVHAHFKAPFGDRIIEGDVEEDIRSAMEDAILVLAEGQSGAIASTAMELLLESSEHPFQESRIQAAVSKVNNLWINVLRATAQIGFLRGYVVKRRDDTRTIKRQVKQLKSLLTARATRAEKRTGETVAIRAAVQRKLDAGLSLNCAQHRVAADRLANELKPHSFSQIRRITLGMKAKKKRRK